MSLKLLRAAARRSTGPASRTVGGQYARCADTSAGSPSECQGEVAQPDASNEPNYCGDSVHSYRALNRVSRERDAAPVSSWSSRSTRRDAGGYRDRPVLRKSPARSDRRRVADVSQRIWCARHGVGTRRQLFRSDWMLDRARRTVLTFPLLPPPQKNRSNAVSQLSCTPETTPSR
jgi:hypothetical protein